MNSKIKKDSKKRIFFDNASTTRIDDQVFKEMGSYFRENYGNPSSLHDFGELAKSAGKKVTMVLYINADKVPTAIKVFISAVLYLNTTTRPL
ncbi:unnamed protein product [marine sediment metagenome]|uniref:Aminotransferase class V domain-containing protein n=1 Tax=marine sediment metagenome TaxID=412755 RepID=X1G108_9ZZZZ